MNRDLTRVLLIEDDADILNINKVFLSGQGYEVASACTLKQALQEVTDYNPNVIVLDVCMPDGSGLDFCKTIRSITTASIIFLTCMDDEEDKVKGLMAGGDDYLTKPYSLNELAARIHALCRRMQVNEQLIFEYPPVRIDATACRAYLYGEDAMLSPKEFQLLLLLVKHAGQPILAETLYERVWGMEPATGLRTVRVHISSIRKKLRMDELNCPQLKTVRGIGYCFDPTA